MKESTLTQEQKNELESYAKWAGKDWKRQLRFDWMKANSKYPGEWAFLQQIRNQFGPDWLRHYKL